jgi:hypothetical protein
MKKINILILTGMLSMSTYAEEMAIEASSEPIPRLAPSKYSVTVYV